MTDLGYLTCQGHQRHCYLQQDLLELETQDHRLGLLAEPVDISIHIHNGFSISGLNDRIKV